METNNKLREALVKIWKEVYFYSFDEEKQDFPHLQEAMLEDPPDHKSLRNSFFAIAHIVDTALAEPVRNCDVGTAEEQTKRYRKFCSAHQYLSSDFSYICKGFGKGRCPFSSSHAKSQCEFAWAQMPYEEGGSK